ncbi:MAG: hypothetical protein ACE5EV_01105 [Gaiellales bacterium]
MRPQRLAVKFFTKPDPAAPVDLEPFIALFHEFIQAKRLDGLLIDVADYSHVPAGPGVILIGHDAEYGLDRAGGLAGLRTLGKRFENATLDEALRQTLCKALRCVAAIESDGRTGLRFETATVEIQLVDRLQAPHTEQALRAALDEAAPAIDLLFGNAVLETAGELDPRSLPTLSAVAAESADVPTLLARLA